MGVLTQEKSPETPAQQGPSAIALIGHKILGKGSGERHLDALTHGPRRIWVSGLARRAVSWGHSVG